MTDYKLRQLIDRAVELDREVSEKTAALKEIKSQLITEAESRDEERVAVDGAGSKWTCAGSSGCLCRVTFPGRRLRSSVDQGSKAGTKILNLAGSAKHQLFSPEVVYKPLPDFRDLARDIIGGGAAERLIKAMEMDSAVRVEFETKPELAS